jgi:glycosyltransferase involved in cell wall biosynthesis
MGLRYYKPFFLHVGNNNWYKNKAGVLRIFSQMIRLDSQKVGSLVLVGQGCPKNLHLMMRELGIANRIRILTEVSNEQLRALYSASEGLIFPSLGEGFGWPVVEAQSCGCPVFTSNRRPLTDIAGAGAVFFDPRDELTAAKMILHSLSDKKRLQENGFLNSKKYATELMISDYERLYSSIAN